MKKDTARLSRQVDVSGLRHAIDTIQISKAFKKHGPGNEKHPNQIPISPEAVAVYLDVVGNYDAIIDVRPKAGATNITFEKAVDGVVVVVEQVRTEQNTLSFFNMWIREK